MTTSAPNCQKKISTLILTYLALHDCHGSVLSDVVKGSMHCGGPDDRLITRVNSQNNAI